MAEVDGRTPEGNPNCKISIKVTGGGGGEDSI